MSEIILDMWLFTQHQSALLVKKSDNINKVSPHTIPWWKQSVNSTSIQSLNLEISKSSIPIFHFNLIMRLRPPGAGFNIQRRISIFTIYTIWNLETRFRAEKRSNIPSRAWPQLRKFQTTKFAVQLKLCKSQKPANVSQISILFLQLSTVCSQSGPFF